MRKKSRKARRLSALSAASAVWVAGTVAFAQDGFTPGGSAPGQIVNATMTNGSLELRDSSTGQVIVSNRGLPIVCAGDPAVTSQVTMTPDPAGADIRVVFTNNATTPKHIRGLELGILALGPMIEQLDHREGAEWVDRNLNTYVGEAREYPTDTYSPVFVLRNDQYAVGVSIQYPILDYRHNVRLNLNLPRGRYLNGEGGAGWAAKFLMESEGPAEGEIVEQPATIGPGETRTYTMSVRVTRNGSEWQRTLVPYRDFFRSTYGGPQYTRREHPVLGFGISDTAHCTSQNPWGYDPAWRPHEIGWGRLTRHIRTNLSAWESVMLWLPSGVYRVNTQNNFPFQFATPYESTAQLRTAFDPVDGFSSVTRDSNRQVGLWWGNSTRIARSWDTPSTEPFHPTNGEHRAIWLNELATAHRAGVNLIGLDTFSVHNSPIWELYPFFAGVLHEYPGMHWVTEPSNCDIMHTLAPTFISAWNDYRQPQTTEDLYRLTQPHALADFIVPGHEMWAGYRYNGWIRWFNQQPTDERVIADMERFANLGYVPCMFVNRNYDTSSVSIARTWEQSVPVDLRQDPATPISLAQYDLTPAAAPPAAAPPADPPPAPTPPTPPTPTDGGDGSGSGGSGANVGTVSGGSGSGSSGSGTSGTGSSGSGSSGSGSSGSGSSGSGSSGSGSSGSGSSGTGSSGSGSSGSSGSGSSGSGGSGSGVVPPVSPTPPPSPTTPDSGIGGESGSGAGSSSGGGSSGGSGASGSGSGGESGGGSGGSSGGAGEEEVPAPTPPPADPQPISSGSSSGSGSSGSGSSGSGSSGSGSSGASGSSGTNSGTGRMVARPGMRSTTTSNTPSNNIRKPGQPTSARVTLPQSPARVTTPPSNSARVNVPSNSANRTIAVRPNAPRQTATTPARSNITSLLNRNRVPVVANVPETPAP